MGQLVYILGRSGTGKSYSLRNFPKDKVAVLNVQGKILPFKGAAAIEQTPTDNSAQIVKALEIYAKNYKSIVVDDYQYVMSNEFMRRSAEKGYDKFTEIARHAWDIAMKVRELPEDVIVYIMCHTDRDDEGNEKIKTIGKLLDEKICLEGLSTIVLKTNVSDGQYTFLTQNNGKDTVKSPADMFPAYAIDNDLWYVDQKIRNYYEFEGHASDDAVAAMDQAVAKPDVTKDAAEGKRRRRSAETKPAEVPAEMKTLAAEHEEADIEAGKMMAQKQKEAEQAIAEATAEPAKRRRKARNAEKENQTEEAPAEEKKEEAAAETTGGEHENRRNSRRTSDDRNSDTRRNEVSEEAAAEQPKKRRRKKRDPEEQQKELDGFLNVPEMDDEELPFV